MGAVSPGVKFLGRKCDHSRPSSGKIKNEWRYAFPPPVRLHVEGQLCLFVEIQFIFFLWFSWSDQTVFNEEYKQQLLISNIPILLSFPHLVVPGITPRVEL